MLNKEQKKLNEEFEEARRQYSEHLQYIEKIKAEAWGKGFLSAFFVLGFLIMISSLYNTCGMVLGFK
jgi:hypothetical protein